MFKYIQPNAPSWPDEETAAVRMRAGRHGHLFIDRRTTITRTIDTSARRSALLALQSRAAKAAANDAMVVDDDDSDEELSKRIQERWRFDSDDGPAVGPLGSDEQDRVLVDDYQSEYIISSLSI